MIGRPRIALKPLAALCRRLAISLEAGIDVRTIWTREANAAHGVARQRFRTIRDSVAAGHTINDSLARTEDYFPEFFRQLAEVGEETGHLPEIFRELAEHYEHQLKLRRTLVSSLTWPVTELAIALGVVGLLIWLMGAVPQFAKQNLDLLGFGLKGTSGLIEYLFILSFIGAAGLLAYRAASRGALWIAPVQRFVQHVPPFGNAMQTLSLSRLTSALHVTLNSGMELRKALKLSLLGTQNAQYMQSVDTVVMAISAGQEIHEAFRRTGIFPATFLDTVQVGEDSGRLVHSMQHLAAQYQDESRAAMHAVTVVLGFAITALIGAIIIFLIFRLYGSYLDTINGALKGR
jgi:type IV pilus assembly protein PilC